MFGKTLVPGSQLVDHAVEADDQAADSSGPWGSILCE
jgi:hypothetical protein